MANDSNDHFADFVITLTVIGVIIAAVVFLVKIVFHFIFSLLPLFLFYLVPFALASFLFGLMFSFLSALFTERNVDFRLLSVIIPFFGFLLYGAVGIPRTQWHTITVIKEAAKAKKAKAKDSQEQRPAPAKQPPKKEDVPEVTQTIERITQWPGLESLYQRVQASLDLEKKFPWQELIYDRPNLAAVLWLSLFLGGPLVFWLFFAGPQQTDEDERFKQSIERPLMQALSEKEERINKLARENVDSRTQIKEQHAEIERLQKRDEYLTKKEKEKAGTHKGVLDSDDF